MAFYVLSTIGVALAVGNAPPCPFLAGTDVRGACRTQFAPFGIKMGWDCSCWKNGVCDSLCLTRCEQAEHIHSRNGVGRNKLRDAVCNPKDRDNSRTQDYLSRLVVTLKEKNERAKQIKEAQKALEAAQHAKELEDKENELRKKHEEATKRQKEKNDRAKLENDKIDAINRRVRKREHQIHLDHLDEVAGRQIRVERHAAQEKYNREAEQRYYNISVHGFAYHSMNWKYIWH